MSDVQLLPTDKLAWHEEQIRVPLPPADVYARLSNAPLEGLLPGTDTFPAVVGTEPVNDVPFPNPGARRRVVLADGSSTLEEVIDDKANEYFSYKVWGYTLRAARPLQYGRGEFWYLPADNGRSTDLRWRYSFKLRGNRFPGALGPLGRFLVTKTFLDRAYADFMRLCLSAIERYVLQPSEG